MDNLYKSPGTMIQQKLTQEAGTPRFFLQLLLVSSLCMLNLSKDLRHASVLLSPTAPLPPPRPLSPSQPFSFKLSGSIFSLLIPSSAYCNLDSALITFLK